MMKHIWSICRLTILEATRRRIVMVGIILGVSFVLLFSVGEFFIFRQISSTVSENDSPVEIQQGLAFIISAGLYAINFLGLAMSALITSDALAGEINSGTIQSLASKPIRRTEIVLGKWLGLGLLCIGYTSLMCTGVITSARLIMGVGIPNPLTAILLISFNALIMVTLTLLFSSTLSTLATGGMVFGLYGLSFIGSWVEQMGAFSKTQIAVDIGIVSSLLMPCEAIWRKVAYETSSPLMRVLGFYSPFSVGAPPSTIMLMYAGFYLVVALGIAINCFEKRDL